MIDPADRGFTLGDGLFETVLVVDGAPRHLSAHLARLDAGCAVLRLPTPDRLAVQAQITAALAGAVGRCALRLSWSAGLGGRGLDRPEPIAPRLTVSLSPAPLPGPARLVTARAVRRNANSPASRLKTLAYLDNVLARAEARAAGGDTALMLNGEGALACADAANLFWIRDGRVFTPALGCGVLPGIARGRLMAAHAVEETLAGREMLEGAEALFLTNSLTGVRAAVSLDGVALAPHPMVAVLARTVGP